MYKEYKSLDFNQIDQEVLAFWSAERVFERSISDRPESESFVFYEGPPSANAMPGIHHVLARAIKDTFCRFQTLNGKRVERKGGWDTHGLPIELAVEKKLGITKEDIGKKLSVDAYNVACRETVMQFKDRWDDLTRKMGYWVDLDNPYITFENEYIESVWHLLGILYHKGLIYKGYTIQPYSPAAGTGLSTHELNQVGCYQDVTDTTVAALFEVVRNEQSAFLFTDENEVLHVAAWTTTPWTLPSNTALCVGPNIDYVTIKTLNPYTKTAQSIILASDLVDKWFGEGKNQAEIVSVSPPFKGRDLADIRYQQLLPFGNPIEVLDTTTDATDAFRIILGDFVTTSDGTGVVHIAPSFGADDRKVARAAGIGALTLVDKQGKFVDTVGEFSGRYVKNYTDDAAYISVDVDIAVHLKQAGKALNVKKYIHSYPHCWRTDKPILYYPLDSWFIRASAVKERMSALNQTINWKPAATGEGRFGKWLENLQDWNLSRSRYWGIPLPIWRTADSTEERIITSIAHLADEIEKANKALGLSQSVPTDLHRPYIDDVILVSESGEPMTRETDLIDVWFDSGSMPYAQKHYPMENPDLLQTRWQADFISEGVDQTRGWFYTLHAIATMCFDSVAYKNVLSTGLVLDESGNKMSKSRGNSVDPFLAIQKYGADPVRWYMLSNCDAWDNLKFSWRKTDPQGNPLPEYSPGIEEVTRKFFGTLYNTYNFFALYANVENWVMDEQNVTPVAARPEIDRWVFSRLHTLVQDYTRLMSDYDATAAVRLIEAFVDELSNWYVRQCRRRFWDMDKAAFETLHECLAAVAQLMSPVAPFFSEWLYNNLTAPIRAKAKANNTPLQYDSVHLTYLVKAETELIDKALEQRMDYAQRICSLALSLRKQEKIRVRQPLSRILLPILNPEFQAQVEAVKDLILQELNIKELEYITDTSGIVNKKVKPNFKLLGKKLGKNMAAAKTMLEGLSQDEITTFEATKSYILLVADEKIPLTLDEVDIVSEDITGWFVATDGTLTVALDVTLTDALLAEGTAREIVNRIQTLRKTRDYNMTDTISVKLQKHAALDGAMAQFKNYICSETLATDLQYADVLADGEPVELNEEVQFLMQVTLN